MSKAEDPFDNAPIERYFNTLKNKCTDLFEFQSYRTAEEFAYVTLQPSPSSYLQCLPLARRNNRLILSTGGITSSLWHSSLQFRSFI